MTKILIISPSDLPVPSVRGGAIETLITDLINQNELHGLLDITLLSVFDNEAAKFAEDFKFTKSSFVNKYILKNKFHDYMIRMINKISLGKLKMKNLFFKRIEDLISNNDFDFIIIEGRHDYVIPVSNIIKKSKLNNNKNNRLVLHVHTDILNINTVNAAEIISKCDFILTVSNFIKKRILEVDQKDNKKIIVYKNATDTINFDRLLYLDFRTNFRRKWDIKESDTVVIFTGRIDESKGVRELIKSVKHSKNKDRIKLLIIGSAWFSVDSETKYMKELKKITSSIEENVIFTGYIPHKDLPKYYAVAEIAVVPSLTNEAAGLVIIEALSSAVPVIATNIGGIPEYADKRCCILIDKDNDFLKSLSNTLDFLIEDKKTYNLLKNNSRSVAEEYSLENYYHNFVNIINKYSADAMCQRGEKL